MVQHNVMVEQRTENIAIEVFSTSPHVDNPHILLQISNIDPLVYWILDLMCRSLAHIYISGNASDRHI